jgi:hypothetical protein
MNQRTLPTTALGVVCLIFLMHAPGTTFARAPHVTFTLNALGLAVRQPDTLMIAGQLNNVGLDDALRVRIEHVRLGPASLLTAVPVRVGRIDSGGSAMVQVSVDAARLVQRSQYELVLVGSYETARSGEDESNADEAKGDEAEADNGKTDKGKTDEGKTGRGEGGDDERRGDRHRFRVEGSLSIPPASPGQAVFGSVTVGAATVSGGGFPAQLPEFDADVNLAAPVVPTAPFVAGTPTATGTSAVAAPIGDPPSVTFKVNRGLGISGAGIGCSGDPAAACAEPSGAVTGGGVVFFSANWAAGYSTDGGNTFTKLNPTTIFPNDAVGFCCDQIVQYVPSIDRFIWVLQGGNSNGYRLATASPAQVVSSGGTAWTYWNLTPQVFGQPVGTGFDYPDLSVGNSYLYMSWDAGDGNGCPSGCTTGFQVARMSLAEIQAAGTLFIEFTDPSDGPSGITWGDHLTQDTGDEIFWAGHNGNNQLRVFSSAESSNTYSWRDVGISSWANNAPTSTTPDGQDWLAKNFNGPNGNSFPRNGIIGATRSFNQLWFAWSAGTDSNFQQPHIEMVTLDRGNNFNPIQQVQIWNNSYAFAYPALATNACSSEVGLSFEYGGNGNYENHVVGFWGDFIAYITTGSDTGTDRFGDYVSVRQATPTQSDPGNLFAAFGFGVNKVASPGTGSTTDVHYVSFGRPATSCVIIP